MALDFDPTTGNFIRVAGEPEPWARATFLVSFDAGAKPFEISVDYPLETYGEGQAPAIGRRAFHRLTVALERRARAEAG